MPRIAKPPSNVDSASCVNPSDATVATAERTIKPEVGERNEALPTLRVEFEKPDPMKLAPGVMSGRVPDYQYKLSPGVSLHPPFAPGVYTSPSRPIPRVTAGYIRNTSRLGRFM